MLQSTLVVSGFFQLLNGARVPSPRCSDPSASTFHCEYDTALQCVDKSGLAVKFRIFSPPGDVAFGSGTVSFIQAKAYIPSDGKTALLEGIRQEPLPGNPSDENYQSSAPNLIYTMIHGVGVVQPNVYDGGPGQKKEFQVEVRPWVRDDNKPCTVTCVIAANAPHWKNVPLPYAHTVVYFSGICGRVREPQHILEIELDEILFNLAPVPPPSPTITRPTTPPPAKRQKFDASRYLPVRASTVTSSSATVTGGTSQEAHTRSDDTQPLSSQESSVSSTTARSPSPAHAAAGLLAQAHIYSTRAAEKRKMS